uniref:Regulator of microtubule dynamics protein n=1 Tax=Meloidogyne incognita TaxID=6306 RepID=A0A914M569_MELIC
MSDCGSSKSSLTTTTGIIIIGALTALNTGLFIHLYRKYKNIGNVILRMEIEKKREIASLKASLSSIRRSLKAIQASSTVSDSEYQDAVEQTWEENRSIESKSFDRFIEAETKNQLPENNCSTVRMANKSPSFERLDKLYEDGLSDELYGELVKLNKEVGDQNGVQILWRLSRVCYQLASSFDDQSAKRKEYMDEGYKHAGIAYEKEPEEFDVIKWYAACTGGRTDFLGTAEKIKQGHKFKELIDKALAKSPKDYALLYMRGRFAYSVAGLSWFERKAAAALFSDPPKATYDEALNDFLAVYKLKPEWIENLVFLGKCYLAKNEKKEAIKYLKMAVEIGEKASKSSDCEEDSDVKEAKELLKKYK